MRSVLVAVAAAFAIGAIAFGGGFIASNFAGAEDRSSDRGEQSSTSDESSDSATLDKVSEDEFSAFVESPPQVESAN